jgi:hypothetical protein
MHYVYVSHGAVYVSHGTVSVSHGAVYVSHGADIRMSVCACCFLTSATALTVFAGIATVGVRVRV